MIKRFVLVLASLLAVAMISQPAFPQGQVTYNAFDFGAWVSTVQTGNSATGAQTITVTNPSGLPFQPFQVGVPIVIGSETVTITSSSGCTSPSTPCVIGATFTATHPTAELITSGTYGLQEAIANMPSIGGTVVVDAKWRGTTGMLTAATGVAAVSISDQRSFPAVLYSWNGSAYVVTSSTVTGAAITSALGYTPGAYAGSAGVPYASAAGASSVANRTQMTAQIASITGMAGDNVWYADILGIDTAKASAIAAANSTNHGQIIKIIPGITGSSSASYQTTGMDLTTTSGAAVSIECGETSELPGHQVTLLYVGTPGGTMISHGTSKFNSGAHITNCIFDGNAGSATAAGKILSLDNQSRYFIANNVFQGGTDADCIVCVGPNTSTTTYENLWLHNKIQTNSGISGRWATVPVTVSGGAVTGYGTISDGGSYCNNGVVAPVPQLIGCTTPPTVTLTMSGSNTGINCTTKYAVTGVSGTGGSGCDNTNTILQIPELQQNTAYGWHSKDQTDYVVEDLVVSNVGLTAAELIEYGAGSYYKEHPYVGQPIGIIDSSPDTDHFSVELDSITQFGIRPSGYNQNWFGISQIFNTGQNPQGYKKFAAVDFVSGNKNIHIYGLTCGSTAAGAGTVPYRSFGSYFNTANPGLTDLTGQGDTVEWNADCTAPSTPFTRTTIGPDRHYGPFVTGLPIVSRSATSAISTTTLAYINTTRTVDIRVAVSCDSAVASATIIPTVTYTDPSSTVQTITGSTATCTTLGASSVSSISATVQVKGATNIQVSTAIANAPTYDFSAFAQERTTN